MRTWIALCALAAVAVGHAAAAALAIGWADLRPVSQHPYAMVASGQEAPDEASAALTLALSGHPVQLTGYLLPHDREGDLVYAFLLLPWTGACSHTPPPPPNQIVVVYPSRPFASSGIYQPVTVTGTIETALEKTQVLMIDGARTIQSGYRISQAEVTSADRVRDGLTVRADNPWQFLRK